MAGSPKKRARKAAAGQLVGTRPEDLTLRQYRDAWDLLTAGHTAKQIRERVGLTGPQLSTLYKHGLPAKGTTKAQPSFEARLSDEIAEFAKDQRKAAKAVSSKAVRVLERASSNAERATMVVEAILRLHQENLVAELRKPQEQRRPMDELMPSEHQLKVLRTLRLYQDMSKAAMTFRLIYGNTPATHPATHPALTVPDETAADSLPAALALMDEVMGEGTGNRIAEEIMAEISRWSADQQAHFAMTAEEPAPYSGQADDDDVIDVEAVPQ